MEIWNYTALELGAALREGACTVPEAVEALRQRERETAACGAYLAVDWERALEEAEALQRRIFRQEPASPLAGVPVLIKDNICTRGIPTTCASAMLKNFVPAYDAAAVERLKQGGMLVLGKANMDEFAMGSTSETSCFGPVKNPWDLTRSPGGSSGGRRPQWRRAVRSVLWAQIRAEAFGSPGPTAESPASSQPMAGCPDTG